MMKQKLKIKKEKKRISLPKKPPKTIEDKKSYNRKKVKSELQKELLIEKN